MNNEIKTRKNLFSHKWIITLTLLTLFNVNPKLGITVLVLLLGLYIYSRTYFNSSKFQTIKNNISKYINDCNNLNDHIEELRQSFIIAKKTDYGEAEFNNISQYKYKKEKLNISYEPNVYDCSRQVCANAQKQPFKYICKYFNISTNEETLNTIEEVLNNFSAAEEGKILLNNKKNQILSSIDSDIPFVIKKFFAKDLEDKLGFNEIEFNMLYFPQFVFRYVSSGGNAGTEFKTTMDLAMLERFISYIDENIKRKKSIAGQRALMTAKLRDEIKERDNYTCCSCNNSIYNEPNLLLEIDHIIPLSKGGLTEKSNLQTLCWKCNRKKGSKITSI